MDRARLAGLALLVLAVATFLGARAAWPQPAWIDDVDPGDPVPARLLARGPAVVRYDAENDTTLALFRCSHWSCEQAVAIRGDARDAAQGDGMVLRPLDATGTLATVPLDAPLTAHPFTVESRYAQAFEPAPRLPGLLARVLAAGALVAGAFLALGVPRGAIGAGTSGTIVLAGLLTNQGGVMILLQLLGAVGSLLLTAVLFAIRSTRRWAPAPLAYLPVLVAAFTMGAPSFVPAQDV